MSSKNFFVTSAPNATPTPRLLGCRPGAGPGSLHSISQNSPLSGGSWNLSIFRRSSKVTPSLENKPPWTTKTFSPSTTARGRY